MNISSFFSSINEFNSNNGMINFYTIFKCALVMFSSEFCDKVNHKKSFMLIFFYSMKYSKFLILSIGLLIMLLMISFAGILGCYNQKNS